MKPLKLSPNLVKLVALLNDGKYHDGTSLGEALQMTRGAVWKAIKKLQNYDIKIDSIKGKGYALLEPILLLNKQVIRKSLQNKKIDLEVIEHISSTNDYLKLFFNKPSLRVCLAETQTSGKGRLQRSWHSPFGKNIYLSLLYPFQRDISEVTGLSLVVSLAIIAACHPYSISKPLLVKWPNDVIYQGKKLAGNLVELQAESHGACAAIIGIGFNVNLLSDEDHEINQPWISLREIIGEYVDRNEFVVRLLNALLTYLQRFEVHGLADFLSEWHEADSLLNKKVTLKGINHHIKGTVKGIDKRGHLIVKQSNGQSGAYASGDTQILKE